MIAREETSIGGSDSPSEGGQFDVVIVGGGFSGCYLLHKLRTHGFKAVIIEAAPGLGGVWQWNNYPGARVDTRVPLYEFSIPEVWKTWNWTERFPTAAELRSYFEHVDKVLDLSKDVVYNTKVTNADFDDCQNMWIVKTEHGTQYTAPWFIPAVGIAATRHFPNWPGLEQFRGQIYHSSFWPRDGVDTQGKRVGVVGTGATGVQLVQEISKSAKELIVFQRTPNMALPLQNEQLSPEKQGKDKLQYPKIHMDRLDSKAGLDFNAYDIATFDHTPEEREAFFEKLWTGGGFRLWSGAYKDGLTDLRANREVYDFWARKIRAMIHDPVKRDILAPIEPPHPFGTKRPSLFKNYYEAFNQQNVKLIDINTNPVTRVTEDGVVTKDGNHIQLDVLALATGYDAINGSYKSIEIRGRGGNLLSKKWEKGTRTSLGLMTAGFPNMFFVYGPQAPTAFSNGPTCVELQGDWIVDALVRHRKAGIQMMEPTLETDEMFARLVFDLTDKTLFPLADSWYMGCNVEGKIREPLSWPAGIPEYRKMILESAANGYAGFRLQ